MLQSSTDVQISDLPGSACIALIVVGMVSNTLTRHLIQIAPVVMVLAASLTMKEMDGRCRFSRCLLFGCSLCSLSGCTLLKIATINTGSFYHSGNFTDNSRLIGICCVYGIFLSLSRLSTARLTTIHFYCVESGYGFYPDLFSIPCLMPCPAIAATCSFSGITNRAGHYPVGIFRFSAPFACI